MKVSCGACRREFETSNPRKRFCDNTCRSRAHRGQTAPPKPRKLPDASTSTPGLVNSVRSELEELGVAETSVGLQAMAIAEMLMSAVTGQAAMSRELSRLMDDAKASAVRKVDPVDELRQWRERGRKSA